MHLHRLLLSVYFVALLGVELPADAPRALPNGEVPNDRRLEPLKDLNGYFPFTPSASPAAWQDRAERVRRQMLVSCGLWPMVAAVEGPAR